jgi:hypothetical protein
MTTSIAFIVAIALICSPVLASEGAGTTETAILKATISELNLEDPASDARSNFVRGDFRFIGVIDYACHLPGREGIPLEPLAERYGMRCLEGTTDTPESPEHKELQGVVSRYGIIYNATLAQLIAERSN